MLTNQPVSNNSTTSVAPLIQIQDNPPDYDTVTSPSEAAPKPHAEQGYALVDTKQRPQENIPLAPGGPSQPYVPGTPMVFHYVNPETHDHITSFLPPNHPEMICLQEGGHITQTKFGLLGILAAIFWFPLGIGLCLLDRRVKCVRCGTVLDDGLSC